MQRYMPRKQKIVMVGAGGLARELHQLIEDIQEESPGSIDFLGWLDEDTSKVGESIHGFPVLGSLEWLERDRDVKVILGIGAPAIRRKVVRQIQSSGNEQFGRLIHPSVRIGHRVELGEGVIICAGVVGTTDFSLGSHTLVNINATLAHEDVIGDFVTIAPAANISGNVKIGEGTDIGTNATVIQGVSIGEWSIVGAGAVVNKSLPANVTAVGAPAKVIKERVVGWQG